MKCICEHPVSVRFRPKGTVKANNKGTFVSPVVLSGNGDFKANNNNILSSPLKFDGECRFVSNAVGNYLFKATFPNSGNLSSNLLGDYVTSALCELETGLDGHLDRIGGTFHEFDCYEKLYPENDFINEGVFTGQYHKHDHNSTPMFDDTDFIQVSGDSSHQLSLTDPSVSFIESYAIFRVSSTRANQRIYDIQFKDPSGNLICQYEEINFRGDDYFSTYSTKPEINNAALPTWHEDYPIFPGSGYTLDFKTQATPLDGYSSLNNGFNEGFQFPSSYYNPVLKISAVEICNSGDFGWRREHFLPVYAGVREKGDRLSRKIDIDSVLYNDPDYQVYPELSTVWENRDGLTNESNSGQKILSYDIDNSYDYRYITHHEESGKLNLKFGHKEPGYVFGFKGGAFGVAFNSAFPVGKQTIQKGVDQWFVVDELYLKVRAKKAAGSDDYTIDVVGWSDDKLLNITPSVDAFLEEISASGEYEISTQPVVNSEQYKEYIVPLDIEAQYNYREASYFESLYLDIYPLPSGACISNLELYVKYTPSNALTLNVVGGDIQRINDRKENTIYPGNDDNILNNATQDIALIENIPQGYSDDDTLKSNYARRWRGCAGVAESAFDQYEFDFSFAFDQSDTPFDITYDLNDLGSPIKNVGLRFTSPNETPGYNSHESINWTSDYGQIADSFDYALVTDDPVNLDTIDTSGGYSAFVRFSPAFNVVPSGSIISKPGTFDLSYYDGTLTCDFIDESVSIVLDSGVVFPIAAVITYNDNNSGLGSLYVKDEAANRTLKSKTGPINSNHNNNDFFLYSNKFVITDLSLGGYNISGAKLIDKDFYNENLNLQQQSAQSFLDSFAVHWYHGESGDTYALPSYIDEDTSDWDLGAFKFDQFAIYEFDCFTKRIGRDYITFSFENDGLPYYSKVDSFTSVINSGLSYHTQIENDFLRLNLDDTSDNFHSVCPRISKDLPRDYLFKERAVVVESVVDYAQSGEIVWEDGKVGPKLIVSLYAKSKDDQELGQNYGLVNRQYHYLTPDMGWEKLHSTFDPESLFDESEPWSVFPEDNYLTEFNHKYYKDDIDSMFLQYDLSIPSGVPYKVDLHLHSVNIKLEDSFVVPSGVFGSLNIYSSGDYIALDSLNCCTSGIANLNDSVLLYTSGVAPEIETDDIELYTCGIEITTSSLDIVSLTKEVETENLNMYTSGNFIVPVEMNLYLHNDQEAIDQDRFLSVYTFASEESSSVDHLNLFAYNSIKSQKGVWDESINFTVRANEPYIDNKFNSSINLFTVAPTVFNENLPLFMFGGDNASLRIQNTLTIRSVCHPLVTMGNSGLPSIDWNGKNYGRNTEEQDEFLFTTPSSEEIRGADTIAWGDCPNGTAIELPIETHDILWQEESCTSGGVIRAKKLYEEEFYGTRKYTGLIPNTPYNITVVGKAGSNDPYNPPNILEEWEYGNVDPINYNDVKISNKGYTVKADQDLIAIGDPTYDIDQYTEAGTVYLYRRDPDVSGQKAGFQLEEQLTLPSGYIGDWYYDRGGRISFPGIGTIPEKQWNIGQEGRKFGSSIGLSNDSGLIAIGAPGAKWTTRTFEEIETSGVNVAILTFTNELDFGDNLNEVFEKIEESNFLYKYFSEPVVNINAKIICVIPTGLFDNEIKSTSHPNIVIKTIPRQILNRPVDDDITQIQLSGIKSAFFEAFPYDESKINNNIPPLIGYYVDNSYSLGKEVVQPALNDFVSFIQSYSLASGLQDFYGSPATSHVYEYVPEVGEGESWNPLTKNLIENFLDTGRLAATDTYKLITSGVGLEYANEDAIEFNYPPESGGRVYVFKQEEDSWNLIQEIKHNDSTFNNFFGRSVDLSKDGSTLIVGSPYTKDSCFIYKYNDVENTRLYSNVGAWLEFRNEKYEEYVDLLTTYNNLRNSMTLAQAGEAVYLQMDKTTKFKCRSDYEFWGNNSIKPFYLDYTYGINDIIGGFTGLFREPMLNASNPRLGYSCAVNDDGSIAVFGSPTDSFGYHENADLYFKHEFYNDPDNSGLSLPNHGTWASTLHSGAVRVFESAKPIVPTDNIILEYNKFGNLSNTLNNTEYYDEFGVEKNKTFISNLSNYQKSDFATVAIPDNVCTVFIITPEIDAANDEVIAEIKRWMSLGDRKLVLVGDDPLWEFDGAYKVSNDIINKILDKLGSRMRLHNARNEYEALLQNNGYNEGYSYNITSSYVPENSNYTSIDSDIKLNAYGVADIKLHIPNINFTAWKDNTVLNNKKYGKCLPYNHKCYMPISHNGDLRARWTESEIGIDGDDIFWERNLPFEFYSGLPKVDPAKAEDLADSINISDPGFAPRPIVVAAEFVENIVRLPAVPAIYESRPIIREVQISIPTDYFMFSEEVLDKQFEWSANEQTYTSLTLNKYGSNNVNAFYDPEPINSRDGILQANGSIETDYTVDTTIELIDLDDQINIAAKQTINNSEAYLISVLASESQGAMSTGNDENIKFYLDIVKDGNSVSNIIQLNSWTGRNSFKSAYYDSQLANVFKSHGHTLQEDFSSDNIPNSKNVLWIANPIGSPTDIQLNKIKNWLNSGNKKIVITYDKFNAANVLDLCNRLGLSIKPWYLPHQNKMAEYTYNTSFLSTLNIPLGTVLTPIQIVDGESLVNAFGVVIDIKNTLTEDYQDFWKIETSVANVKFPAIPGSGYRIFYDWVSDLPEETRSFGMYINDVYVKPTYGRMIGRALDPETCEAYSRDLNGLFSYSAFKNIESPGFGTAINKNYIDIQVPHDSDEIDIYFYANYRVPANSNIIPRTCKLLSVSGCLTPINKLTSIENTTIQEIIGYEDVLIREAQEARTIVMPATVRPILTDNTKYCLEENCSCGGQLVDDGPVIIAEEPESFSNFSYGKERSKIVLVADSTLVNGRFDFNNDTPLVSGVPVLTNEEYFNNVERFISSINRQVLPEKGYNYTGKITSPDTSSVPIYDFLVGSGLSKNYFANEKDFDPNKVVPHICLDFEKAKKRVYQEFQSSLSTYGAEQTYSVDVSGVTYKDSILSGNLVSDYMLQFGDDIMHSVSGYKGDLFGYSVDIHKNKLIVGSPYNAYKYLVDFNASTDEELEDSVEIGIDGGAGSVFAFEKITGEGWTLQSKLRPSGLYVSPNSDNFGYSVSIDGDLIAASAPNHDYGISYTDNKGAFLRRAFNASFDIGERIATEALNNIQYNGEDLAYNGQYLIYGQTINTGAVFIFEDKVDNWSTRDKSWTQVTKITHDFNTGQSIDISRNYRADSDYIMAAASLNKDVYLSDGILREQPHIDLENSSKIYAHVFGQNRSVDSVSIEVGDSNVTSSGLVYSDNLGQIFLEASGYDNRPISLIKHRPYIHSVLGNVAMGDYTDDILNLFSFSDNFKTDDSINLYTSGPDSHTVYNTLEMTTKSAFFAVPSGLNFVIDADQPTEIENSGMFMMTSGVGFIEPILHLRVRGK